MPFPTLCHRCGNSLSGTSLVCLQCQVHYRFDQSLAEHLTLRSGPFLVEGKGERDARLYCLARASNGYYYLQSINWLTGECYPALLLSAHPANYPANIPVVDGSGRLLVPLGGSHEVAIVDSPTSSSPGVRPFNLKKYGKPLACLLDSQKRPLIVHTKAHKAGVLALAPDLRSVDEARHLPDFDAEDQEVIPVSDRRVLFRVAKAPARSAWAMFDASTEAVTSVAPSDDPGEHPIPCSSVHGQVALAGRDTLRLISPDATIRSVRLPDGVTHLSAVAVDSRHRLYFGVNTGWGEQAEGAALYFPNDDGGDGYLWASLPTRPQHILPPLESSKRALVLAHGSKDGSYLLSVDLVTTRTDYLASVPPGCCGGRLVVRGPAAAFGVGNMIYKRPVYHDDDAGIPSRAVTTSSSSRPVATSPAKPAATPSAKPAVIPGAGTRVAPGLPAGQPAKPEAPQLKLRIDLQSPGRAAIGDVCLVTLVLTAEDQRSSFRIRRVAPSAQGNQTWMNYQCGNAQFSQKLETQHSGSVQFIFKQTGQIPVTLEITIEDEHRRWQIFTKSSHFQVEDPLRRPPGTYYTASGDMIVINRTNS